MLGGGASVPRVSFIVCVSGFLPSGGEPLTESAVLEQSEVGGPLRSLVKATRPG